MNPPENVAHYRITAKLGEGGMGEVWRATDTKLHRDVAVKILPEAFAADPDRMARFTREAQVLASLNHPNIAAIYGVEERALIMELVEGTELHGPLEPSAALPMIHQLIDALEYAHEKGVVHRDLKPANIKITPEGKLKVLDFGLAKAMTSDGGTGDPMSSPTLTMRATMAGTIMGTAAYMSPEQARGHEVDKRADIWAFGAIVYEMLAGKQFFAGPTVSDTLAAVLRSDLDLSAIAPPLREVVAECLVRDPRQRLRDIGDARILLKAAPPQTSVVSASPYRWIAAALALAAGVATWAPWRHSVAADRPLVRLSVDLGPDAMVGTRVTAILSPDASRLVFPTKGPTGKPVLSVRRLDQAKATPIPDTEGAFDPFFSPDGKWVGFFADGKLKKVPVEGGGAIVLCDALNARGAAWGPDGNIVFVPGISAGGLMRVADSGGTPARFTDTEAYYRWPQFLPDGRSLVLTVHQLPTQFDGARIAAVPLAGGRMKTVVQGGYFGRYLPTGHMIYAHNGTIFGVHFDAAKLEPHGTPVPLIDDVAATAFSGAGQFDFSRDGTLVYLPGRAGSGYPIISVDENGKPGPFLDTPHLYSGIRLSPDGKRLAYLPDAYGDMWVYDLERNTPSRLTFNAQVVAFAWTPDGRHLAYTTGTNGTQFGKTFWVRSDGGGAPVELTVPEAFGPSGFTPDGRTMVGVGRGMQGPGAANIMTVPLDLTDPEHPKSGKPEVLVNQGTSAALSPDGRWIAHSSMETGAVEVYVRPFPGPGGKWLVSRDSGTYPLWSHDGRRLYYANTDGRIMVANVTTKGDTFSADPPRVLWDKTQAFGGAIAPFAVLPDGKRIAVYQPVSATQSGNVHVIFLLNFFDEVKRRIP